MVLQRGRHLHCVLLLLQQLLLLHHHPKVRHGSSDSSGGIGAVTTIGGATAATSTAPHGGRRRRHCRHGSIQLWQPPPLKCKVWQRGHHQFLLRLLLDEPQWQGGHRLAEAERHLAARCAALEG